MTGAVEGGAEPIHGVNIKVPSFDEYNILTWFKIFESRLKTHKITSVTTKFNHLLGHLPIAISTKVSEVVADDEDFGALKNELIRLFSKSKPEMFKDILQRDNILCQSQQSFLMT